MNWLNRLLIANWRIALVTIVLLSVWLGGVWVGEVRTQRAWDAERHQSELVLIRQEQKSADIKRSQEQVNHEISNEFSQRSEKMDADWRSGGSFRVRSNSTDSDENLPSIPQHPTRIDGAASHSVPDTSRHEVAMSCDQLVQDAARTTLMLVELQRWYSKQAELLK